MAVDLKLDTGRSYGVSTPGAAFDLRPGVVPSDWFFNNTFAWPVPSGPAPITLKPTPLDPQWETTVYDGTQNTEHFRRYTKDDFNVLIGTTPTMYPRTNTTDWTLLTREAHTSLTGKEILEFGEGLYIEFCSSGVHGTNKKIMELQFGNASPSKAFWLTLYENGKGYLSSGAIDLSNPANQLADGYIVPNGFGTVVNCWIKLFIFSHGRNKLSVISSTGNGFLYENRLVSKAQPKPAQNNGFTPLSALPMGNDEILLNSPNLMKAGYYRLDTFTKTALKIRPIPYFQTGTIQPKLHSLIQVNNLPSLSGSDIHHKSTYDILGMDRNTIAPHVTYTPIADSAQTHSLNPGILLTRPNAHHKDVNKTPQFYRDEAVINPVGVSKSDSSTSILADTIELSHSQSEDSLTGKIKIRFAENHFAYSQGFGLPFQLEDNGNVWLKSLLIKPSWEDKGQPKYTGTVFENRQQYLTFDMMGFEKDLEEAFIQCVTRFDGIGIDNAVELLLTSIGFPADGSQWDIDPIAVDSNGEKISKTSIGETDNEPTNLSSVAQSVSNWIKYFIDTYTSCSTYPYHWVSGFRPFFNSGTGKYEWRFFFRNPDTFTGSVAVLYPTQEIATHYDGSIDPLFAYQDVYFSMSKIDKTEPECNHLFVYGIEQTVKQNTEEQDTTDANDNSDSILSAEISDPASINPATPLGSRPTNWLGKDKRVVYIDGSLNTQQLVNTATALMFKRLSNARESTVIEAEWNPSILIWDTITVWSWFEVIPHPNVNYQTMLANTANFKKTDWRIIGLDIEHIQESNSNPGISQRRRARYSLERQLT